MKSKPRPDKLALDVHTVRPLALERVIGGVAKPWHEDPFKRRDPANESIQI